MKLFKYESKQHINTSINNCWNFFSNPKNLEKITPRYMGFEIIDTIDNEMYAGQIIQYYVKPLLGIKMIWVTEITQVKDKAFFIDEQRIGPYKIWHHKHFFKEKDRGVEMIDIVHYALPFGLLGRFAHSLFIKRQLTKIFSYRFQIINQLFNEKE